MESLGFHRGNNVSDQWGRVVDMVIDDKWKEVLVVEWDLPFAAYCVLNIISYTYKTLGDILNGML